MSQGGLAAAGLKAKYGLTDLKSALERERHVLQKDPASHRAADEAMNPVSDTACGLLRSSSSESNGSADAQALQVPTLASDHGSPLQLRPSMGYACEGSDDPEASTEHPGHDDEEGAHEVDARSSEGSEAELAQTPSSEACTVDEVRAAAGLSHRKGPDIDWQQLGQLLSDTGFPALPHEVNCLALLVIAPVHLIHNGNVCSVSCEDLSHYSWVHKVTIAQDALPPQCVSVHHRPKH